MITLGISSFTVKVKKTGRVRGPNLSDPQLKVIGEAMVDAQKKRWDDGINAEGNAARALSKKYFFMKRAATHQTSPIRDMKMTGVTVANFTLRKASGGIIRAENTSRAARDHANRAQGAEQMIGFAGSDQIAVFRESQLQYGVLLQKAWVPIG
jgi:hypothetical protein